VQDLPWILVVLPCHVAVTLSSSCLQTHGCAGQPGAGHGASQGGVGRQQQVHRGPLLGRDFWSTSLLQGAASSGLAARVALWSQGCLQQEAGWIYQRDSSHYPHLWHV